MITLIAALDRNRAIGRDGAMPWHLPDDLKRFKALTLGKPVLMGRRTALAIGRALPGRPNLVLTRGATAPFAGQEVVHSLDEALERVAGEPPINPNVRHPGESRDPVAFAQYAELHRRWVPDTAARFRDDEKNQGAVGAELCVIGGGEVYALALPRATQLRLTEIDITTPDADTYFPAFDPRDWREVAREHHAADAKHPVAFDFVDYERVQSAGTEPLSRRERVRGEGTTLAR